MQQKILGEKRNEGLLILQGYQATASRLPKKLFKMKENVFDIACQRIMEGRNTGQNFPELWSFGTDLSVPMQC